MMIGEKAGSSIPTDGGLAGAREGIAAGELLRYRPVVRAMLWLATVLVGGYHFVLHCATVGLDEPMGSWETGYAFIARAWPAQYHFAHYPLGHDGYGPGYPAFVQPFIRMGLDVYVAHRVASLAALLAACALLGWILIRLRCSACITAAALAIFYALNAGSYSVQARPDFLVLFAIIGMMILGFRFARGEIRLAPFAVALGILTLGAALTKAYALFVWALVIGHGLLFGNRRPAFLAALISGMIVAAGVGAFARDNPLYWMEVFDGQVLQAAPSFAWLCHQTADFTLLTAGLLVTASIGVGAGSLRAWREWRAGQRGVFQSDQLYWCWLLALSIIFFAAGPGWHEGAYLTYCFHWILPPLIVLASLATRSATARIDPIWFELSLVANLAILMATAPGFPKADPEWEELRRDILRAPGRVAVDYIMEPMADGKAGVHVVDTGRLGYVVQEPFFIRRKSPAVLRAREEIARFTDREAARLFGPNPVDTLYLDCLVRPSPDPGSRRSILVPRNGLPYFGGENLAAYTPVRLYRIHPYYFATNLPRQQAGTAVTTIVKFVRKK